MAESSLRAAGLTAATLAGREWVRFFRQRHRVVAAILQPLVFWLLFGAGLRGTFRPPPGAGAADYAGYLFPGIVMLVVLFTAIFATISIIEDRREGFLQSVLAAPVPRAALVLGKVAGGAVLAAAQGGGLLLLAPLAGLQLSAAAALEALALLLVAAAGLTALGFCIAWRMDSTQGFHAVMMLFLMPMWLLSGAFFPVTDDTPVWMAWVIRANPLTYGVEGLRGALASAGAAPPAVCWAVSMGFAAAATALACLLARHTSRKDWS